MKTYIGVPGDKPAITVVNAVTGATKTLEGEFGWGKANLFAGNVAKAILADYLADPAQALRLHGRFKWRVVQQWQEGKAWTLTGIEIANALTEIAEAEQGMGAQRAKVNQEVAPIESDSVRDPFTGAVTAPVMKS